MHDHVSFKIKDEEVFANEEVAACQIEFTALCFNHGVDDWFPVFCGNENAGILRLKTIYHDHHA